jgi:23S rRNA (uracil1939-C5)-methyltransferase
MTEALLPDLLKAAEAGDPSLPAADLYCGVGLFAAFLQDRFSRIDLLEQNPDALALARQNLKGGENHYYAQSDNDWARDQAGKAGAYGFAVVDPPRRGLSQTMAHALAQAGPPVLAYVSCDPATLARDSGLLLRGGYALQSVSLYDFYPQTAHIESLAVFYREKHSPA